MATVRRVARELIDDTELGRFELRDGDELLAWLDYRPAGPSVILAHTEVAEGHEDQGFGGEIVREAIERLSAQGKTVIPTCPFAAAYIERHPELGAALDPRFRPRGR